MCKHIKENEIKPCYSKSNINKHGNYFFDWFLKTRCRWWIFGRWVKHYRTFIPTIRELFSFAFKRRECAKVQMHMQMVMLFLIIIIAIRLGTMNITIVASLLITWMVRLMMCIGFIYARIWISRRFRYRFVWIWAVTVTRRFIAIIRRVTNRVFGTWTTDKTWYTTWFRCLY